MTRMRRRPGEVRDAIILFLKNVEDEATVSQIQTAVSQTLGQPVPPSSVRSYLNLNHPTLFIRTKRGCYRLAQE